MCTRHVENGPSSTRVGRLLALQRCRCQRAICFAKFRGIIEELLKFLQSLWLLSRHVQDAYVTHLCICVKQIVQLLNNNNDNL